MQIPDRTMLIPDENYYFNSKKLLDEHVERGQLKIRRK